MSSTIIFPSSASFFFTYLLYPSRYSFSCFTSTLLSSTSRLLITSWTSLSISFTFFHLGCAFQLFSSSLELFKTHYSWEGLLSFLILEYLFAIYYQSQLPLQTNLSWFLLLLSYLKYFYHAPFECFYAFP